jgi:hypothetical protein
MSVMLTVNTLSSSIAKIQRNLSKLPLEAYQEFRKNTPVKTGNARRKTRLKGKTIEANYPYAEVLDKGRHMTRRGMRGSDQAPVGMTKPTEAFIKKRMKQILKGR